MPLLERTRVEVYLPDLPSSQYQNLLRSLEEEFTYAFGGASIIRGLEGSYLSASGELIPDRINLLYCDAPLALLKGLLQRRHICAPVKTRGNGGIVGRDSTDFSRVGLSRDLANTDCSYVKSPEQRSLCYGYFSTDYTDCAEPSMKRAR